MTNSYRIGVFPLGIRMAIGNFPYAVEQNELIRWANQSKVGISTAGIQDAIGREYILEAFMILTERQLEAVRKGEVVSLTVGHTECVLVRKDCFPGTSATIYDAGDWTEDELSVLAEQMFDGLDG